MEVRRPGALLVFGDLHSGSLCIMSEEVRFGDNYTDLSSESGVNAGFQFEFFCEHCNDAWRTPFVPYRRGQVSGWLGKASDLLGGLFGSAGDVVSGMAESGFGTARDAAFRDAVQLARGRFHRCGTCAQYVCDRCWNRERGLCLQCAPDTDAEVEAARARGETEAAVEAATEEGRSRGKKRDVKTAKQLVCPSCGEKSGGGKFCASCGAKMDAKAFCPECGKPVTMTDAFCRECGHRLTS